MVRRGYLEKHGIDRNAIRRDLLFFALPGFSVFILGLIVCGRDDYDGMVGTLVRILLAPEAARQLPVSKIVRLVLMIAGFAIAFTALFTLKRFYASTWKPACRGRMRLLGPFLLPSVSTRSAPTARGSRCVSETWMRRSRAS